MAHVGARTRTVPFTGPFTTRRSSPQWNRALPFTSGLLQDIVNLAVGAAMTVELAVAGPIEKGIGVKMYSGQTRHCQLAENLRRLPS